MHTPTNHDGGDASAAALTDTCSRQPAGLQSNRAAQDMEARPPTRAQSENSTATNYGNLARPASESEHFRPA